VRELSPIHFYPFFDGKPFSQHRASTRNIEHFPGIRAWRICHRLLRNYGAFEEPLVKNFVRQILKGLAYLHEKDIIHRDIKGANILVDNKGGIKISDFGISKKVEDSALFLFRWRSGADRVSRLVNRFPCSSPVIARLRFLDGTRSRETNGVHT
jgi:serine/threonine protein kinase